MRRHRAGACRVRCPPQACARSATDAPPRAQLPAQAPPRQLVRRGRDPQAFAPIGAPYARCHPLRRRQQLPDAPRGDCAHRRRSRARDGHLQQGRCQGASQRAVAPACPRSESRGMPSAHCDEQPALHLTPGPRRLLPASRLLPPQTSRLRASALTCSRVRAPAKIAIRAARLRMLTSARYPCCLRRRRCQQVPQEVRRERSAAGQQQVDGEQERPRRLRHPRLGARQWRLCLLPLVRPAKLRYCQLRRVLIRCLLLAPRLPGSSRWAAAASATATAGRCTTR
jgi:hypothetical protein